VRPRASSQHAGTTASGWRRSTAGHGRWDPSWAVYFSPHGEAMQAIIKSIRNAQGTILVQAYLLSGVTQRR
jgi:hypothetical protein